MAKVTIDKVIEELFIAFDSIPESSIIKNLPLVDFYLKFATTLDYRELMEEKRRELLYLEENREAFEILESKFNQIDGVTEVNVLPVISTIQVIRVAYKRGDKRDTAIFYLDNNQIVYNSKEKIKLTEEETLTVAKALTAIHNSFLTKEDSELIERVKKSTVVDIVSTILEYYKVTPDVSGEEFFIVSFTHNGNNYNFNGSSWSVRPKDGTINSENRELYENLEAEVTSRVPISKFIAKNIETIVGEMNASKANEDNGEDNK